MGSIDMGLKSLNFFTVLVTYYIIVSVDSYDTPTPLVEILNPMGFRVSIPDSPGVELFAFHGNINKEMIGNEAGQFSVDILRQRNGLWTYTNPTASLNPGDTLYFWTHVRVNKIGYEKFFQQFKVPTDSASVSDDIIDPRSSTQPSEDVLIVRNNLLPELVTNHKK